MRAIFSVKRTPTDVALLTKSFAVTNTDGRRIIDQVVDTYSASLRVRHSAGLSKRDRHFRTRSVAPPKRKARDHRPVCHGAIPEGNR